MIARALCGAKMWLLITLAIFFVSFVVSPRLLAVLVSNITNVVAIKLLRVTPSPFLTNQRQEGCGLPTHSDLFEIRPSSVAALAPSELPMPALGAVAQIDCPAAVKLVATHKEDLPRNEVDALWMGYLREQTGQHGAAVELWRRYKVGVYFMRLAQVASRQGSSERVEALTRFATEVDPQNWAFQLTRGRLLQNRDPVLAAEALRRSINLDPSKAEGYVELSSLERARNNYAEAINLCKKATSIDSKNPVAWHCLGEAAFYSSQWAPAEEAFANEAALSGDQASSLFWLGRTYRYKGDNAKASQVLQQAISRVRGDRQLAAFAWFELGQVFAQQELQEKAAGAFHCVLQLAPDFQYRDEVLSKLTSLGGSDNQSNQVGQCLP